ncbi:hypothetical protein [Metallosphaera yellowstonensis]|nr:hypothetical protein [Metallosphaera yellowstonensis]
MNNSSMASEYILRSMRTLKESSDAFNDGDMYYTALRLSETLENMSNVLLSLYGILDISFSPVEVLGFLEISREIDQKVKGIINEIQDLWRQLSALKMLNESPTKAPSVLTRGQEMKLILDRVTSLFDKVQGIFDDFHH